MTLIDAAQHVQNLFIGSLKADLGPARFTNVVVVDHTYTANALDYTSGGLGIHRHNDIMACAAQVIKKSSCEDPCGCT